jgi:hypothetical protein
MLLVNQCKAVLKWFNFGDLTKEQFDALILLSTIKLSADETLRARILQKIKQEGDLVCFDIITDCVEFLTTKADCRVLANDNVHLNALQKTQQERLQSRMHPPSQQR